MFGEFLPLSGAGKLRLATEEEEEEEVDINLEAALPILLLLLLPVLCPSSGFGGSSEGHLVLSTVVVEFFPENKSV